MNNDNAPIEERLGRLGKRLAEQPSVLESVMREVDRAPAVRTSRFNQGRIFAMLVKPRSLVAAAAVLALVVFGLRPWNANQENGAGAWWLAPPSAWAGELQAAIDQAERQGYSCREQYINRIAGGSQATSSTTNTFFTAGNRYRRDIYEQGQLRESQWYVQAPDGLAMTSVRYADKTYTVTHDRTARGESGDPLAQIEALAQRLDESGRRVGTTRVEGREAVEFEVASEQLDRQTDNATMHVWLDQATKMPLKITYQFAPQPAVGTVVTTTLVQDHFDWKPTLPGGTFEPVIPSGFTQVESE